MLGLSDHHPWPTKGAGQQQFGPMPLGASDPDDLYRVALGMSGGSGGSAWCCATHVMTVPLLFGRHICIGTTLAFFATACTPLLNAMLSQMIFACCCATCLCGFTFGMMHPFWALGQCYPEGALGVVRVVRKGLCPPQRGEARPLVSVGSFAMPVDLHIHDSLTALDPYNTRMVGSGAWVV